jgi:hypothetical protein
MAHPRADRALFSKGGDGRAGFKKVRERQNGGNLMTRKECFGSIKEVTLENGMTRTQTKLECRDCADFRDCLFHVKVEDDERKQALIAKIIDHSEVHSNEIGTCLLDFLNRMYSNPIGSALFKNLILFYEVSQDDSSLTITVPLSRSLLRLLHHRSADAVQPFDPAQSEESQASEQEFILRVILLQRRFPNNRKANIGLIAHEVARMFASNDHGMNQVLEMLSELEIKIFGKMDVRLRTNWLIEKWGLQEEHEAFRNEAAQLGIDKNKWSI